MLSVSPLTSTVLLIVFILTSTFLVLNVLFPAIETYRTHASINRGKELLTHLNNAIKSLALESGGAKRILNLEVKEGRIEILPKSNLILFSAEKETKAFPWGSISRSGELEILCSGRVLSRVIDVDNDGVEEVTLTSGAISFSFDRLSFNGELANLNFTLLNKLTNASFSFNLSFFQDNKTCGFATINATFLKSGVNELGVSAIELNSSNCNLTLAFLLHSADFLRVLVFSNASSNFTVKLSFNQSFPSVCVGNYSKRGSFEADLLLAKFASLCDSENSCVGVFPMSGRAISLSIANSSGWDVISLTMQRGGSFAIFSASNACEILRKRLSHSSWIGAPINYSLARPCTPLVELITKSELGGEPISLRGFSRLEVEKQNNRVLINKR